MSIKEHSRTQIRLSIIIPVYNVEEYVEKCIKSCAEQDLSFQEYEIIVVNDGSLDGSLAICERLDAEYAHVHIISQKNKGLSGARNIGLSVAKGEYVWFVDSDDWISPSLLTSICSKLIDSLDILWLGHVVEMNHRIVSSSIPGAVDKYCSGQFFYANFVKSENFIWKFIYRRDFLVEQRLFFCEGILYEDFEFTPRALAVAQRCFTYPVPCYHYLVRENSIVANVKLKHIEDRIWICRQHLKFVTNINLDEEFISTLKDIINTCVISCAQMVARHNLIFPLIFGSVLKSLKKKDSRLMINQIKLSFIKLNFYGYSFVYKIILYFFR